MPTLSITKTYADGNILTEADLDNIRTSIQTWANTTKLDDTNIQANGISPDKLDIADSEYLEFGTGNDGRIGVISDDLVVENVTSDKDIIFKVNDGGVSGTEVCRMNGDASEILMAAGKNINLNTTGKVINSAAPSAGTDLVNKTYADSLLPTGTILAYAVATAPSGFLLCDGSQVSRTTYATLFALIGITAGQGDGSTTFNVPDLRGRFLRGRDAAAGRDPDAATRTAMNTGGATGDNAFSVQDSAVGPHKHNVDVTAGGPDGAGTAGIIGLVGSADAADKIVRNNSATINTESRPINANVNFIIKT